MAKKTYISNGQLRTLKALHTYTEKNEEPPTVVELAIEAGYSDTWTATILQQLDAGGFIKREKGWRQTRLTAKGYKALKGAK